MRVKALPARGHVVLLTIVCAIMMAAAPVAAQSYTVLHEFRLGDLADGWGPRAGLILGTDGNLYGSTLGTIFKITPAGVLTTLSNEVGSSRRIAQGTDGNFYGTTGFTAFRMTPAGVVTTLYSFSFPPELAFPSGLARGADGNIYGTTAEGGPLNAGTLFRVTTDGALTFVGFGGFPYGEFPTREGPLKSPNGILYGVTESGGFYNNGTIYVVSDGGYAFPAYSFTEYVDRQTESESPRGGAERSQFP